MDLINDSETLKNGIFFKLNGTKSNEIKRISNF